MISTLDVYKRQGYAHEQGKGCVVAVNKWDAVEKDGNTMNEFKKKLENDFSFMSYVPFLFISALTGQRVEKLYDLIRHVHEKNSMRITTGMLNEMCIRDRIYFFEKACAISGYLLGVNPFNQPGVEAYKKNMFALLGKPGYEDLQGELLEKLK